MELQLTTAWDGGMKRPCELGSIGGQAVARNEADVEVRMCRKLWEDGHITRAVDALNLLVQRGCSVPNNLFYRPLKWCIADKDLVLGRHIHALSVKSGYEGDAFLATHLIGLYASHARLEEAIRVFAKVTRPSVYNWATIIVAHARHGEPRQAIQLYQQMVKSKVKPDSHIFSAVLKACAIAGDLSMGKDVHAHVLASARRPHIFVQTGLVEMYAKCGSIENARRVFDSLRYRNVVTWTAMIAGYAQQGMGQEALDLYGSMQLEGITPPDAVTFVCLLQASASEGVLALQQGKQLHAQIEQRGLLHDVVLGGSLVNMYAKCGSLQDARKVFDRIPHKNVMAWNAMIAGYAQQNMGQEAFRLYNRMQQEAMTSPDTVTYVCLLQACPSVGILALRQGRHIHVQIVKRGLQNDLVVGSSLVNMYAKCGSIEDARKVFDRLSHRNVVTWNAMIAGYVQQGKSQEALSLYRSMQQEETTSPDSVTFVCALQACSCVAALPLGKQLHVQIQQRGLQADMAVGAGLVNMYAKCGSMFASQQVFDSLPETNIEAWSALIGGYTCQGDSDVVFDLVARMRQEGIRPNGITFLSVLTVCSHVGLVDKGRKIFTAMKMEHGIDPTVEHYTCMIDLLSRAGHLDEALRIAQTMPFSPSGAVWHTLLGACQKWSNVEVGQQAFELAASLDEKDTYAYVLMSNIYAGAQMWEEANEMQARRVTSKAWKLPGQSWWTDTGGVVHAFVTGDEKHYENGLKRAAQKRI